MKNVRPDEVLCLQSHDWIARPILCRLGDLRIVLFQGFDKTVVSISSKKMRNGILPGDLRITQYQEPSIVHLLFREGLKIAINSG